MTRTELSEAVGLLRHLLAVLLSTAISPQLRLTVGSLSAEAESRIRAADLGAPLLAAFTTAREAGATFDGMGRVRAQIFAEAPVGPAAKTVARAGVLFALFQQARILAGIQFGSRQEVDLALASVNAGFDPAEEYAADSGDAASYRAIVALRGAVVRDLSQRSRPLPRIIRYEMGRPLPAVVVANRLYGDASRTDELIRENSPTHPLFMPVSGRALSR